jgi:hypothetical protein
MVSVTRRLRSWWVPVGIAVLLAGMGLRALPGRASSSQAAAAGTGFELVGHDPLLSRGMNAAPALYDDAATGKTYVYVGSRTDSFNGHPHPGVLIRDTTDPTHIRDAGEIGAPSQGLDGQTSRELRVWPSKKLLIVLDFTCSSQIHACDPVTDLATGTKYGFYFYDLSDAEHPALIGSYNPTQIPHEFFLWVDPAHAGRALLYFTTPSSSTTASNLTVADISGVAAAKPAIELAHWSANADYPADVRETQDVRLHSLSVSADGTRAYVAHLGGGFLVLDTSVLTNPAAPVPVPITLRTPVANRAAWGSPGTHSAVKIPGTHYALTTDEVYGDALTPLQLGKGVHGCPWGWARTIDVADETHPKVTAEFKIAQNQQSFCTTADGLDPTNHATTSYASHNPTVLSNLAFVTWHSGGLQALDLSDPTHPTSAATYSPAPLASVATEDPALSMGRNKVVAWSYPILHHQGKQTLVYFVDLRNGLYVLRYTGVHAKQVGKIGFLEGNSNLGDAPRLDGYQPPTGPLPTGLTWGPATATTFHLDSDAPAGEADRGADFGGAAGGPFMGPAAPAGPAKVQSTSRFGNPGAAANPLLAYWGYRGAVQLSGPMTLHLWLSAPGAPGVLPTPVSVELFVDGTARLGHTVGTSWVPPTFNVDVGPNPTLVTITIPDASFVALSNVLLQVGSAAGTTDTQPKNLEVIYGSPDQDSTLSTSMAFPS